MACRVLIVEDEALLADDLETMVTQGGHAVCGKVRSASAALMLARSQEPDIVFMDVRLAGPRDGVDAAQTILKVHDCGIIYITAHADNVTRARIQRATPDAAVLSKPALWSEIEAACARVSRCADRPN